MGIAIFGIGDTYHKCKALFKNEIIDFFVDNNRLKWGTLVDGKEVISAETARQRNFEIIYILSIYYQEIKKQLLRLGIPKGKIKCVHDLSLERSFSFREYPAYVNAHEKHRGKVLLISHELSCTGAPMMLLYAAMVLKDNGYQVYIASPCDGALRNICLKNGISILIDESIPYTKLNYISNIDDFDLVIVNTLSLYYLAEDYSQRTPVVWWIHEGEKGYGLVPSLPYTNYQFHKILACSRLAKEAFNKCFPQLSIDVLLCGMKDFYMPKVSIRKKQEKMVFAVIGTIEIRKGQDIFLNAIRQLPLNVVNGSEFWMIGNDKAVQSRNFSPSIKQQADTLPNVFMQSELSHDEIKAVFHEIDVLVCPSREESLSLVSIEAMMCGHPCVVTDHTGIADYISSGENGIVCPVENAGSVAEAMTYCYLHQDSMQQMGRNARKTFEMFFSLPVFAERFMPIMDNILYSWNRDIYCGNGGVHEKQQKG